MRLHTDKRQGSMTRSGGSFRLRIALLSVSISALLLVGSGVLVWQLIGRFSQERLDRELRNIGQQNLQRVLGREHWVRLDRSLAYVAEGADGAAYVLYVRNGDREVFKSPGWPEKLEVGAFPDPDGYAVSEHVSTGEPLPPPPRPGEEISRANPALPKKLAYFRTVEAGGRLWRVGVMGNPYSTLILAVDLNHYQADLWRLGRLCLTAFAAMLLAAAVGAWFLAGRALRPVEELTRLAEGLTAQGLDRRLSLKTQDKEFSRLVLVFNSMLERLEKSFHQAQRFSADASHELRTPLARLQLELESMLPELPPGSSQQQAVVSLLDEVHRLKGLVERLLLLSKADSGRLALVRQAIDLAQLQASVVEDCQVQATEEGLRVEAQAEAGLVVKGDPLLLEQALQNLAGNAVKYNQPEGCIRFSLTREEGRAVLRVSNTGPGLGAAERERLFERFYRADASRGQTSGFGLGLSLAREIARAHGGDLVLEPEKQDGLTCFALWLPLEPVA